MEILHNLSLQPNDSLKLNLKGRHRGSWSLRHNYELRASEAAIASSAALRICSSCLLTQNEAAQAKAPRPNIQEPSP